MWGIIYSILAGVFMSIQGVFNTRLSEKIGTWETNTIVQGTGFALTLILIFAIGNGNIKEYSKSNKLYLLGGVIGVAIIFTVMEGMKKLGPTYAVSTILVAQLISAAIIDALGLFDTEQLKFGLNKFIGVAVMIIGIIIFKWKS